MPRPPNLLWIVATQWRAGATGYAGDPHAATPCLDALAARSVNYAQAVTPHPFGPFARAALLTGMPSPANGVRDYFDPLPENARTIAHALRDRGYATAFFGKWHLARRDPAAPLVGAAHAQTVVPPAGRGGFDFWEGFESGFLLNDPWLHGTRLPEPTRFPGYQSDVLAARAAVWLDENDHRKTKEENLPPWFCMVSFEAPHPPYDAPAAGVAPCDPRALTLPANVPRGGELEARVRRELAGYYAHIAATDRAIGRLLAAAGDDTLVVFASVHGDMHGAHGLLRKGWPHEESVRVPLLVRWPGQTAGTKSMAAVSLLDLSAMTLAWAESRPSGAAASAAQISMPSVVRLPHQCDREWRGVRTAQRKLVLNADGTPWLFFDLERDPGEERNLVAEPTRAAEIAALAQQVG
ncbi:MAG: sulfatase-like hydrolase/transferase [Opitutae bacterium]|nr:sulfatase-like hydrolase/transferase [Opitutae bacterium]